MAARAQERRADRDAAAARDDRPGVPPREVKTHDLHAGREQGRGVRRLRTTSRGAETAAEPPRRPARPSGARARGPAPRVGSGCRRAGVAELADAPGLGPGGLRPLEVRLLSPASAAASRTRRCRRAASSGEELGVLAHRPALLRRRRRSPARPRWIRATNSSSALEADRGAAGRRLEERRACASRRRARGRSRRAGRCRRRTRSRGRPRGSGGRRRSASRSRRRASAPAGASRPRSACRPRRAGRASRGRAPGSARARSGGGSGAQRASSSSSSSVVAVDRLGPVGLVCSA